MHSFENVTSIERKRANWVVLERLFKVKGCLHVSAAVLVRSLLSSANSTAAGCLLQKRNIPIEQQQVEAIINAEGDAASEVLQAIYSFINSEAYR